MIKLILCLIIIFFAIVAGSSLIGEPGYILINFKDTIIELTLASAIIYLVLITFVLFAIIKVLRSGFSFSRGTWHKITFANKRKSEREFKQGVAAYLLEDYPQTEKLLAKSHDKGAMADISFLIAAAAAEKQQQNANCEYYLDCLTQIPIDKQFGLERVLVVIQQHLRLKNIDKARALIDEYHKYIGHDSRLLVLEMHLSLNEQRFDRVIELLPQAYKQKSIPQKQISTWQATAYFAKFDLLIRKQTAEALMTYWKKLPKKLKQQEAILFAYCEALAKHGLDKNLNEILLPAFHINASNDFLHKVRSLPIKQATLLINEVQRHLHKDAKSDKWLACLAYLAYVDGQYDMAAKAYSSLMHHEQADYDQQDLIIYAKVLSALKQPEQANKLLFKVLDNTN